MSFADKRILFVILEDGNAANMRTNAIMEARKWLQEKRSGSKKKLESEFDVTKLATPSQVGTFSCRLCQFCELDMG